MPILNQKIETFSGIWVTVKYREVLEMHFENYS